VSESAPSRYRTLLGLSRAALFWERLWPRLCPLAMVIGVFVAVALLDVLPILPAWAHVMALLAFAGAVAGALWYAVPGFRPISAIAARRRLETDNGLAHRPLAALEDRLAIGLDDPGAESLWTTHRKRMAEQVGTLSVRPPAPGMAKLDPWGVRAAVVLLLVIGLAAGGGEAETRVERALTPGLGGSAGQAASVEIWLTPPEYTSVPPLFLKAGTPVTAPSGIVEVPAGSALLARVAGVDEAPVLISGQTETGFDAIDDTAKARVYRAETQVLDGDSLRVTAAGRDLATWPLRVTPDAPPEIAFSAPPDATQQGFLTIAYEAADDYGVSRVTAVITPAETDSDASTSAEIRLDLPLPALDARSLAAASSHDLTDHALAGRPVMIKLEAEDAGDNMALGEAVSMVLPERTFSHPVAKKIIAERKRLEGRTSEIRWDVARELGRIAARPEHFGHEPVVSLALSIAKARLIRDRAPSAVPSVRTLLWETALRLEEGTVPLAERQMRNARQQLWEALRGNASLAEIERLMNELQRALDKYLAAVAAELARRGQSFMPTDPLAKTLRSQDLRDLIEMARQLARGGSREGAKQMLAELQRMLEAMRSGMRLKSQGKDLMEAQRLMHELRELAERQQGLLDQTFERMRGRETAGPGQQKGSSQKDGENNQNGGGQGAGDQEALRRALGELIKGIDSFAGAIPKPMTGADRAMRGASKALGSDRLKNALGLQTRAVEHLNQAIEGAKSLMAKRLGGSPGMFSGDPDEFGDEDGDIFGRKPGDGSRGFGVGQVEIPDRMELRRAQEILQELRRRAGERERPPPELRYIDRLLQQF